MEYDIPQALISLFPGAQWSLLGNDYEGLDWLDKNISKPSKEQIEEEINRLQEEYDYYEYSRKRAAEYPDFRDYLDGIVKGDQEQIDAYIDACLAIKEKYPKPE